MNSVRTVVLITSLVLLGACGNDEPAPAAADTAAATVSAEPLPAPVAATENAQEPFEVQADAIAVGRAIGANGAVSEAGTSYSLDDTIHVSMPASSAPAGSDLTVYWTYQDGTAHKQETIPMPAGAEFVNFQFSRADGMQPGKYNVQIDAGFEPVGVVDFQVD